MSGVNGSYRGTRGISDFERSVLGLDRYRIRIIDTHESAGVRTGRYDQSIRKNPEGIRGAELDRSALQDEVIAVDGPPRIDVQSDYCAVFRKPKVCA
jgi:hypothetical protein